MSEFLLPFLGWKALTLQSWRSWVTYGLPATIWLGAHGAFDGAPTVQPQTQLNPGFQKVELAQLPQFPGLIIGVGVARDDEGQRIQAQVIEGGDRVQPILAQVTNNVMAPRISLSEFGLHPKKDGSPSEVSVAVGAILERKDGTQCRFYTDETVKFGRFGAEIKEIGIDEVRDPRAHDAIDKAIAKVIPRDIGLAQC